MTQKYQVKVSMKQAAIVETGIVLKQGDFGMQIEIEVLDFDATGTTPQIVFRKAMGAVESTTITVSGNKYTYTFKGTELDTPGKCFCDLKLKNSTTQRISTASFMFKVVADTLDGLAEESSSYSDTIAQIREEIETEINDVNAKAGEQTEAYETFVVQATDFNFDMSSPNTQITVDFTSPSNGIIGYFKISDRELTAFANENGTIIGTDRYRFTIPRYSALVVTIRETGGTQAKVKTYSNLTKNDIILLGNSWAGNYAPDNYLGIMWEKYLKKQVSDNQASLNDIGAKFVLTGNTTPGSNFETSHISCKIHQNEKFCIKVDADDMDAQALIVLRSNNTNIVVIDNYNFGKYLFFTADRDLDNVYFYISSARITKAAALSMYLGYGTLYNTWAQQEQTKETYSDEVQLVKSRVVDFESDKNLNSDVGTIENAGIESGKPVQIKVNVTGTAPTNMQIRSRGSYIASVPSFGEWFSITPEADYSQISMLVSDSYFVDDFSAQLYISKSGIIKDIYDDRERITELETTKEDKQQFESDTVNVDTNLNVNANICTINGLNIKSGTEFMVMEKISGTFPTTSQLRKRTTFITGIKQNYNKWIKITAEFDIDTISVYYDSDYVTGAFNVQLLVAIGNEKELHDDTVRLDHIDDKASYLPSYYTETWLNNLESQMQTLNNGIVNGVAFAFVTDLHFLANRENSKYLLRHFMDKGCFPFIISGGDYAYAYGSQTLVERDLAKLKAYQEFIGDKFYQVRGNHDFTIKTSSTENTGYTAPYSVTYNHMMRPSEWQVENCIPEHMCYTIDNKSQRTRIVCLNTSDGQSNDTSTPFGVYYRVTKDQIQWLLDVALNVENYRIIFVHHIPFDSSLYGYDSACDELFKIAKALKNKEVYTYDGLSKDFTNTTNTFVASISGHCHCDQAATTDNVLSITTTSDGTFQDDGYNRAFDTLSEQAFDVFYINFDSSTINAVRVGAGTNRNWTYV